MCPRIARIILTSWNTGIALTQFTRCSNIWWCWHPCLALSVTLCHRMNVSRVPLGVCNNKAHISKCCGRGRRRRSRASPWGAAEWPTKGRWPDAQSADARRPDTLQAVDDISWLLAVVGCDACHPHDGWVSDLPHYIISVRNPSSSNVFLFPHSWAADGICPRIPIVWSLQRTLPFFWDSAYGWITSIQLSLEIMALGSLTSFKRAMKTILAI